MDADSGEPSEPIAGGPDLIWESEKAFLTRCLRRMLWDQPRGKRGGVGAIPGRGKA